MFTMHRIYFPLIALFLLPNFSWATSFACSHKEAKGNDARIEFRQTEADKTGAIYEVNFPKIEAHEEPMVIASFEAQEAGAKISIGAAELKLEDKGEYYSGKLLYALYSGGITIRVIATYTDGFRCTIAIKNERKHNK